MPLFSEPCAESTYSKEEEEEEKERKKQREGKESCKRQSHHQSPSCLEGALLNSEPTRSSTETITLYLQCLEQRRVGSPSQGLRLFPLVSILASLFLFCIGRVKGLLDDFCRMGWGAAEGKGGEERRGEGKGEQAQGSFPVWFTSHCLAFLRRSPASPFPHPQVDRSPSMI